MKVSELIKKLQSFQEDLDVICYQEDGKSQLFDIEEISIHHATKKRINNKPVLKFGESKDSEEHVIISVISDF